MPSVATRLAFAEQYWTSKEGKPFSVKGRDWVVDEFWKPACGFRLWPNDVKRLCDECKASSGKIQEYDQEHKRHESEICSGLQQLAIVCTVLNLPRRSGKTFNALAYAASSICVSKNESITYVASAKDQTDQLFEENVKIPIEGNAALDALCHVANKEVKVKANKSFFECVATSHRSITGRGRTCIIIDEARDVPAQVAAALLPSVFDHSGWECPNGHVHHEGKPRVLTCSACGSKLQPWAARIIIESSSGVLEDNENDWFNELVVSLQENPHPQFHLYQTGEVINPRISKSTVAAVSEVFGRLESMRHYIDIEVNNVARRKGEDFLSKEDINRCINTRLGNTEGTSDPTVGFLDVSSTVDKTSLVLLSARDAKWERCYVSRIDFWEPQKLPNGLIDEAMILDHLDRYVPTFPGLISLGVDTRMMPWAMHMVKVIKQSKRGWGRKVDAFNGGADERNAAWATLEARILSGTIEIPAHPELKKELLGVQRYITAQNKVEIRDRSRSRRHADIAESLAECCRRAFVRQTAARVSIGAANRGDTPKARINAQVHRPITNFSGNY